MTQHEYTTFETRNGFAALAWNQNGVSGLRLPAHTEKGVEASILRRFPHAARAAPPPAILDLINGITRYFNGERIDFSDVLLDLGPQDPFFAKVYTEVRKLHWGETTTYGTVAKALGAEPQAARDVGQAMASNPAPLIIPCHRVLGAGGKAGGFSAPGGAASKLKMLEIEGVSIMNDKNDTHTNPSRTQTGFEF